MCEGRSAGSEPALGIDRVEVLETRDWCQKGPKGRGSKATEDVKPSGDWGDPGDQTSEPVGSEGIGRNRHERVREGRTPVDPETPDDGGHSSVR